MEKALGETKTLEKLKLSDDFELYDLNDNGTLHIQLNTSLSEVDLGFCPYNWDCPIDGRLVYVSHMLCDSVGCSV